MKTIIILVVVFGAGVLAGIGFQCYETLNPLAKATVSIGTSVLGVGQAFFDRVTQLVQSSNVELWWMGTGAILVLLLIRVLAKFGK